jgi:hypothetical protein
MLQQCTNPDDARLLREAIDHITRATGCSEPLPQALAS